MIGINLISQTDDEADRLRFGEYPSKETYTKERAREGGRVSMFVTGYCQLMVTLHVLAFGMVLFGIFGPNGEADLQGIFLLGLGLIACAALLVPAAAGVFLASSTRLGLGRYLIFIGAPYVIALAFLIFV